ncbi:MAG TPA: lysophospholipid acyltransferase family protein [Alphaproteobacteria bacterium]|nr:lysophospholipid acyltransferase family protein [Alphaproteobacteria bacterium]
MKLVNRLAKNRTTFAIACWLMARYIRFVERTSRWTMHGAEAIQEMLVRGEPFVATFWHGRMVLMPGAWRRVGAGRSMRMLISLHRDGVTISRVIGHLGIETIAGSSSRGGMKALQEILRTLRAGGSVGITPDGPRGPRMRASPGVATVASRMSVPVFAVSFSATRRRVFKSWDRFLLPLPFGRVVVVMKGPIEVPRNATAAALEDMRARIEDALNEATREADRACGLTPVEPAPEPASDAAGMAADRT